MRPEDQFSRNAGDYRDEPLFAEGEDLGWMVEAAALSGSGIEEVLDVGSGAGHTAIAFAPFVRRCVGVDVTAAMVREATVLAAARGLDNVTFVLGAAERLPFPDGGADRVTCRFAAHHFESVESAVSEVARVLRPGGAFLLIDHCAPEDDVLDAFINQLDRTRDPSHVREYRLSEWRSLLAASGLSCDVARRWELRLEFDNWVRRARVAPAAETRLVELLTSAPEVCRAAFGIAIDATGRPQSFRIHCALLRGAKLGGC